MDEISPVSLQSDVPAVDEVEQREANLGAVDQDEVEQCEAEERAIPFCFTGNAPEYFRIWIVNTLLSIATLGIYSAWAKVRTKQYFYRNTQVDGVSFDYLANPIAILKGRVIVVAFLGLVAWSHYYYLPAYLASLGVLFLATPWAVVRSMAFTARNSAYRNIRFSFSGRASDAFGVYVKTTLFYVVSCGLGYPWAQWTLTRFVIWRHYYGDLQFRWYAKCSAYYRIYIISGLIMGLGYFLLAQLVLGSIVTADDELSLATVATVTISFLYFLIPTAYLRASLSNLLYDRMVIGDHWLVSTQRPLDLFKLYAINALAIVLSFGLLIPWAKIRLARYRADTLSLQVVGDLYAESRSADEPGAIGQGLTDLGDLDLGISV